MASAQKRGFRFPWGNDPRREEPPPPNDEPTLAQRLGAAPDDLGRGPFDLATVEPEDANVTPPADSEEPSAADASATAEPDVQPLDLPAEPIDASMPVADTGPADHVADAAADSSQATAATAPASEIGPGESPAEPADGPRTAWPENDRRSKSATPPPTGRPRPSSKTGPERQDNPLMIGLVRAMRDASRVARDEALASLRAEADARGEAIRNRTTVAAGDRRKAADADVTAIREWSKAEMVRIRQETESRIAARRMQLIAETEHEAAAAGDLFARLIATVHGYESETADFFDALMAEDDPARLAGMAEQMPPPPSLDEFPAGTSAAVPASKPRPERGQGATVKPASPRVGPAKAKTVAKPAGAEPEAPVDAEALDAEAPPAVEPSAAEQAVEPAEVPHDSEPAQGLVAELESEPEADALDADAAAAAEAAALVGLDSQTQLIVSGLSSVGAIAAFKAALMRVPAVSAVSVSAGTDGDFVFTVTHAAEAEVRDAIRDLEAFQARIIADDGMSLVVVAHEPAA